MKTTQRFLVLAAVFCAVFSTPLFAQGFYWESSVSGAPGGERSAKNYMMPKMFKMVQEGQETIITDLDKKLVIRVHDADKTYSVMTFDEMEARMKQAGGGTDARMEEMQAKMKEMPEEQRKMMEKMMGPMAGGGGPIEVKKSAEKKTIAGYVCTKFEIIQGERPIMAVWATKDVKGFGTMRNDWEEFSRRMTEQIPGKMGKGIAAGMKKIDGFPMETEIGPVVSTVTKIEQRSTPASAFAAPAGYTKVDDPLLKAKEE